MSPSPQHSPPPSQAPVILVVGRRGCGKTSWINQHVIARAPRLLVFDHMAEFRQAPGVSVVYHLEEAIAFFKARPSGLARVAFCPVGPVTPELFALACRVPFAFRDLCMVVDEIDSLAGSVNPPAPEEFRRLIHFGRHIGCAFVGASRRPADVARLFSSQATRYICFQTFEPKDRTYLRSILGAAADRLAQLPELHFLEYDGRQVTEGVVRPGG